MSEDDRPKPKSSAVQRPPRPGAGSAEGNRTQIGVGGPPSAGPGARPPQRVQGQPAATGGAARPELPKPSETGHGEPPRRPIPPRPGGASGPSPASKRDSAREHPSTRPPVPTGELRPSRQEVPPSRQQRPAPRAQPTRPLPAPSGLASRQPRPSLPTRSSEAEAQRAELARPRPSRPGLGQPAASVSFKPAPPRPGTTPQGGSPSAPTPVQASDDRPDVSWSFESEPPGPELGDRAASPSSRPPAATPQPQGRQEPTPSLRAGDVAAELIELARSINGSSPPGPAVARAESRVSAPIDPTPTPAITVAESDTSHSVSVELPAVPQPAVARDEALPAPVRPESSPPAAIDIEVRDEASAAAVRPSLADPVPSANRALTRDGPSSREPRAVRRERLRAARPPRPLAPEGEREHATPDRLTQSAASQRTEMQGAAGAYLLSHEQLDAFRTRAAWLEQEGDARDDPGSKARTLIVASELWAMAGDVSHARELAERAAAYAGSTALAERQARWLAWVDHDPASVSATLDVEIRTSPSPETRCHAAMLLADLHRCVFDDPENAARKLDVATRANSADPRAHVAKLVQQLCASPEPPRLRVPEAEPLSQLASALVRLTRLRGLSTTQPPEAPTAALPYVRAALSTGNRERALAGLDVLAQLPELRFAVGWLTACLAAPDRATRPLAVERLRGLLRDSPSRTARRALACRAVEQGELDALKAAFDGDEQKAFDAGDRIALALLTGAPAEQLKPWLESIEPDGALRPFVDACAATSAPPSELPEFMSGDATTRAEVLLGRTLVGCASSGDLEEAIRRHAFTHPTSPLPRVLGMELGLRNNAAERIAQLLADWDDGSPSSSDESSRWLATAMLHEVAGNESARLDAYTRVLDSDPSCEPAARALMPSAPPARCATLLTGLADALTPGIRPALLLLEAALRLGPSDEQFEPLLKRAAEIDSSCPLAYRVGEQAARLRGDADGLADWLRHAREVSTDPFEAALYAVREGLLTVEQDPDTGASLLREAFEARTHDVALRQLVERVSVTVDAERGRWREQLAERLQSTARASLLTEAALEYERAGDLASAVRTAEAAVQSGGSALALVISERLHQTGPRASELIQGLIDAARVATDPREQAELYRRLSNIDAARGEQASSLLWNSAILERVHDDLPSLRKLEHAFVTQGRLSDLELIATTLAGLLDRTEANAHAHLVARLLALSDRWDAARPMVELAFGLRPAPLWALRAMAAYASLARDDERLLLVFELLRSHSLHAVDAATLSLRAAETAARLGNLPLARETVERALDLVPNHIVALVTRAEILDALGEYRQTAEALESVASASSVDAHRQQALYRAAVTWLDKAHDVDRGRAALERANEVDRIYEPVFERLRDLYAARGDRAELVTLLERRLSHTTSADERFALEVTRARALAQVGDSQAAHEALDSALQARPNDVDALAALATVCFEEQDWSGAERAWLKLSQLLDDSLARVSVFISLGDLYAAKLDNLGQAEWAYQQALSGAPDDAETQAKLVRVCGRLGHANKAIALQNTLIEASESAEQRRDRTIELAWVHDALLGNTREAEATLEKARRAWPQDPEVLRAFAAFYRHNDQETALEVLLDRVAAEARRALNTGRFEASFFEVLGSVAELRGQQDAAALARAAVAAVAGEDSGLVGVGLRAASPQLDELLAPEHLSLPLRALLRKTGTALDSAFPIDLQALGAKKPGPEWGGEIEALRNAAVIVSPEPPVVWVSDSVGPVCIPVTTSPPQLVVGTALLELTDRRMLDFAFVRTVKVLQTRAAAICRASPVELWPMMAAFLSALAPSWQPPGLDPVRLMPMRERIANALPDSLDDDVSALAMEAVALIGNRASQLGSLVSEFGNRAGLLAIGCPTAALRAVGLAGPRATLPPQDGPERQKWIVRTGEARDLMIFSVSEHYVQAQRQLGVG
jgi:tetratricopeptide (TPR) repeat protein